MKQRIRLSESSLHRIIKESVKRVLNENNEYDLSPQEIIEKYYNNFSEAYKLIDKANKLISAVNRYEIESIISKIDAGEVLITSYFLAFKAKKIVRCSSVLF